MAAVRFLILFLLPLSLPFPCFSQSEADALLKLKKSFSQADSLNNWAPGSSPCIKRWVGVMCAADTIIGLHLTDLDIAGKVDIDALLEIPGLRTLSLMNNEFSGPIPELNKLGSLKALYLSGNKFSGEIPSDFFKAMGSLKKVWINNNTFTGKIPESVMQLPFLTQLHVEGNQFSGEIPPLKYPQKMTSIDFSFNKLEGQIPESLSRFDASVFQGNVGLCGKPLEKGCGAGQAAGSGGDPTSSGNQKTMIVIGTFIAILFFVAVAIFSATRKDDDFSVLGNKPHKGQVSMHVPESTRKPTMETTNRKSADSKRGSSHNGGGRNGITDLVMVNNDKGVFGMQDLMKAAAEVLGNGGLGSAYKAVMANGLSVVVKRMREMNRLGKEAFDAEMRRFGKLKHPNLLTPLAYHFRREEKLMVTEYMPKGSLLYVLHGDRGIIHADLNWVTRLKIIRGIAQGLSFIYSEFAAYELPHGNLKSSNVILTENYEPLLSDYAMQPLANTNNVAQSLFAYKTPEYVQHQQISPKSDVYCLGIIILEILTGKFPSQYLSNGKGGIDIVHWVQTSISENKEEELIDPEISSDENSLGQMLQLLKIGVACIESNPEMRLGMKEAIRRIEEALT
ncbi:hypothetical protein SLEP1_g34290 [Rubroshorea leprosula]|uniref:Protein kinase domain-containing protein n=1 Tax=Rubroshorea leprosula TaxID=152421 RepID=A0AAV5KJL3_9ROSI|nr:hypothetical protein SLEP1_g34290 [Rubroshorea leprosula]